MSYLPLDMDKSAGFLLQQYYFKNIKPIVDYLENTQRVDPPQVVIWGDALLNIQRGVTTIVRNADVFFVAIVQEALIAGDRETAIRYVNDCLRLKPTPEVLEALWATIVKSRRWEKINGNLRGYLYVAIRNESSRIKAEREMSDRIWKRAGQVDLIKDLNDTYLDSDICCRDPLQSVIEKEEISQLFNILYELMGDGTERDKKIITLFLKGYSPAEIIKSTGHDWSAWQSTQRKAIRRMKKYFDQSV